MAFPHYIVLSVFFLIFNFCTCTNRLNVTLNDFAPATATWYGPPDGHGTDTGACGFGDVSKPPYNSFIAAGNQALYKSGKGCGDCYEVKCTKNPECSGNSIKIRITDECPGDCNSVPIWFDFGGHAFGALAKSGQEATLRNAGKIQILYRSVGC